MEIKDILLESDYKYSQVEEKIQLLLEKIRNYLLVQINNLGITLCQEESIANLLRIYNITIMDYKERRKINTKMLTDILEVMSDIQNSPILYIKSPYANLKTSPLYGYNEEKLIYLKGYNKTDNLEVLISLVKELDKKFLKERDTIKYTRIKKIYE